LATTTLNSSSSWSYDGGSGEDRLSIAGNISLSAAAAGSYSAIYAVFYSGTSTIPTEISHPVYISVKAATTGGGSTSSSFAVTNYTNVGEAGSSKQITISGTGLSAVQSITFNGQNVAFSTQTNSLNNVIAIQCNPITLPSKGDYNLVITPSSGAPFSGTFHVVTPLAIFFPCSSANNSPEICFNQCVSAGSALSQLNGRVIATSSSEYDDYNNTYYWEHSASNSGQFGSTGEREQVQWQFSWDNSNWYDISGATQRNYAPGPVQQTTYYRRVSTHIEGSFGHRAYWYTSATVTISVMGKVPTPVVSSYAFANCGNAGQTLQIAVNSDVANKSLNWWVPYSGWTVNGYSTVNNNSSYVTTNTEVSIAIPAGTPIGTYNIAVSSNGDCGVKSADAIITVTVNQDPPTTPSNIYFQQNYNTTQCYWYYDVICSIVPGATSYRATDNYGHAADGQIIASGGYVTFPLNIYGGQPVTVSITATNACGMEQASSTTYLDQADPQCDYQYNIVLYPNPSSAGVKLNNGGLAGQATFYDAQGVVRKTITLHEKQGETDVNILDLPNGTYHVRIMSNGKVRFDKQLLVQH